MGKNTTGKGGKGTIRTKKGNVPSFQEKDEDYVVLKKTAGDNWARSLPATWGRGEKKNSTGVVVQAGVSHSSRGQKRGWKDDGGEGA